MVRGIAGGVVGAGVFALALLGWYSLEEVPASYASLVDSVVRVEEGKGYGSGVLVASDKVLTAKHVAKDAEHGVVETRDRRVFAIEKVVYSTKFDIALITLAKPIPNAKIAKTTCETPIEDTQLMAIGHPLGTTWAVFRFLLSGYTEDKDTPPGSLVVQGASNPGLSGGPAFNSKGVVVGLMTHRVLEQGMGATGLGLLLPFSSVCASLGDPLKEALGW